MRLIAAAIFPAVTVVSGHFHGFRNMFEVMNKDSCSISSLIVFSLVFVTDFCNAPPAHLHFRTEISGFRTLIYIQIEQFLCHKLIRFNRCKDISGLNMKPFESPDILFYGRHGTAGLYQYGTLRQIKCPLPVQR
jgi:hypothetical protein